MRGFWADERVDGKLWNIKKIYFKWIYDYFKAKEKEFLTYADKVVSLTENGKKEMLTWKINGLSENNIKVIPCSADFSLFELVSDEKRKVAKENIGLSNDHFVLAYLGSIGTWYMLDEMLEFFKNLKLKLPSAKFLFLTPDSADKIYKRGTHYQLQPNDFIIKYSARKDIPKYAHASDFSIFFIRPSFSKKSSSPTKMGELMAMGIPLICNGNVGDVTQIMSNPTAGFCIDELNEKSYNSVIPDIIDWQENTPMAIRKYAKNIYDLKNGIDLYLNLYRQICGNNLA